MITKKTVFGLVIVAIVLAAGAYTCMSKESSKGLVSIRTTGATFPQYQIQKWIEIYLKEHPNVKIEYEGGGSGHGQEAFLQGLTHIGRTDPPVRESTWNQFKKTGDQPLQFPEVVGAVVVSYNVPGLNSLKLSKDALVGIFIGNIIYWDDPVLKELNPNANLPHKEIIVVHRSDSSGTTSIFTTYMSLINKTWKSRVGAGKTVEWPTDSMGRGLGGKGNPGVVTVLMQTPYSICYTELSFALEEGLSVAEIENAQGAFVKPTKNTIKAAVSAVSSHIPSPSEGYMEDLSQLLNAPGEDSYPIVAFTHLLVWKNLGGKHYSTKEAKAIKDFLFWILTDGQKEENLAPGYVGLPPEVAEMGLSAVNSIHE